MVCGWLAPFIEVIFSWSLNGVLWYEIGVLFSLGSSVSTLWVSSISWLWDTSSMLMMVWVLAHAEVIEVQYSVGFVVYFMALGNFVNVDDDFEFGRMLKLSIRFDILKMLKALL